jgi:hypothetical protein
MLLKAQPEYVPHGRAHLRWAAASVTVAPYRRATVAETQLRAGSPRTGGPLVCGGGGGRPRRGRPPATPATGRRCPWLTHGAAGTVRCR